MNNLSYREENALRALKETIARKFNLIEYRVFGSKARGDDSLYSDIDVMVEIKGLTSLIKSEILDMVFEINLRYDVFISPTLFSWKEIVEGPMVESPIYKAIMKEGISY